MILFSLFEIELKTLKNIDLFTAKRMRKETSNGKSIGNRAVASNGARRTRDPSFHSHPEILRNPHILYEF